MSVDVPGSHVIHGWGCTPTGDLPPASVAAEECSNQRSLRTMLTKGWRRTALFVILIFLMLLIFLNITLTLWIISALKLSMNGLGPIRIVKGGIQMEGHAWVLDNLVASTITAQVAQPITLHSHRNFTVLVSEPSRLEYSKLFLKRDKLEFSGRSFNVRDSRGSSVFHASKDEVRLFSETLAVDGDGGLVVKSAIQAPYVRAPPGSDLRLESLTRKLDLRAPQSIFLESRAGRIDITSHQDIKLDSVVGSIKIDAPNIVMNNLKEAKTTKTVQRGIRPTKVYQLCACATGKLFLAAPDAPCAAIDDDKDLCR